MLLVSTNRQLNNNKNIYNWIAHSLFTQSRHTPPTARSMYIRAQ